MKLKLTDILVIIILIFCQDLRGQLTVISVTSINQWYASLQIPLVRHSVPISDWLKLVPGVTNHFWLFLFHIFFGIRVLQNVTRKTVKWLRSLWWLKPLPFQMMEFFFYLKNVGEILNNIYFQAPIGRPSSCIRLCGIWIPPAASASINEMEKSLRLEGPSETDLLGFETLQWTGVSFGEYVLCPICFDEQRAYRDVLCIPRYPLSSFRDTKTVPSPPLFYANN